MYGSIKRDAVYINNLRGFLLREYGIESLNIIPAKRGYYGETWMVGAAGQSYFVKLDYSAAHKSIYERSFPVIEQLHNHDIDFISRIVKTADGRLSARYNGAVLGVFDWIDGNNIQNERTKIAEYEMLSKIYTIPADGLTIPREDFSGDSAKRFFKMWAALGDNNIDSLFEKNRAKLERRAARLKHFSALCRGDASGFVITHGDPGGNVIMNGEKFYIVDWDGPVLAPPERDAWFSCLYPQFSGWAEASFHKALLDNGIEYALRPERLAYYCYHSFFFYLTEYLDTWFDVGDRFGNMAKKLDEYFHCWIEEQIKYADQKY
ncbi:MAG: aminoglycoside phosphotransferase family protein [Oscillospiraceae bacterium]|jgi:hypothetical protein|nr:aminoglycoside phosphotransferase family protein [Oscillospiraceae bacterium]